MSNVFTTAEALDRLGPTPRFVVVMCGIAGSGKTTFSQRLEERGFRRLSIDEIVWNAAGRYGIDYPEQAYGEKLAAARDQLKAEVARLLAEDQSVVVDSAFWSLAHRQEFRSLVSANGGQSQVVYLKTPLVSVRERLAQRSARFDANAAFPIDAQRLEQFADSFEAPDEQEDALIVVD